ncbi:MAG TPA: secretin N-terminal domain-containing protein [Sedimentisphaerales bacterium]|nr:secretin N-terminal domain-containing protein [Sedimentisphaerales bacterium]
MTSSMKSGWLRLLTVLVFIIPADMGAAPQSGSQSAQKTEVLSPLEQRLQKNISVDFVERPIDEVIRMMAEQADVDIIKSPAVEGIVTARLTDVPLEEALNNILAAHGYGCIKDRNMIRIVPLKDITQEAERFVSKTYQITYADVKEVAEALDKFKSPQGIVSFSKGTSNVIVTDTESKIKAMDTFIEQIDRITPQLLVEARIYDITSREAFDLGIEWEAGRNTTIGDTIGDNPTAGHRRPFAIGRVGMATDEAEDIVGNFRIGWFAGGIDIDAVIRAEQKNIDAKLLANPRILVLDNEKALFDIVREIPYKETSITGSTVQETIKFKNVGVRFEVTPHVTRDGMVRLNIVPEFGVVVSQDPDTGVPTVDTRKVNTIALVKDGHTVVLGGLRKKDVAKQINKVPLLGDLPLLGGLFRFEGEDTAVTELVVFITPRIIEQPVMSQVEKQAYEATEFKGPGVATTRAERK